ncbi:MAG: Uma2 family endonuclease [Acetobacteraceae bacterium]|nr:Uma2 family endonuclease [Acetobacteraceae bacterium]
MDGDHALAASGHPRAGERGELPEGQIIRATPGGDRHIGCVMRWRTSSSRPWARVSVRMAVRLDSLNAPELDLALVRPRADGHRSGGPPRVGDVLLLIEAANRSLREDCEVKSRIQARHVVPELRVVDLPGARILVHAAPGPGGHGMVRAVRAGDSLAPRCRPMPCSRLRTSWAGRPPLDGPRDA